MARPTNEELARRKAEAEAAKLAAEKQDEKEPESTTETPPETPEPTPEDAPIGAEDITEEQAAKRVQVGTEWLKLQPGEPPQDPQLGTETPAWKEWKAKQKK